MRGLSSLSACDIHSCFLIPLVGVSFNFFPSRLTGQWSELHLEGSLHTWLRVRGILAAQPKKVSKENERMLHWPGKDKVFPGLPLDTEKNKLPDVSQTMR